MEIDHEEFAELSGVYRTIAREIGRDGAIALHRLYHGQQILFPQKLYTREYILKEVNERGKEKSLGEIAHQYGYTERRIRQLIQQHLKDTNKDKEIVYNE